MVTVTEYGVMQLSRYGNGSSINNDVIQGSMPTCKTLIIIKGPLGRIYMLGAAMFTI